MSLNFGSIPQSLSLLLPSLRPLDRLELCLVQEVGNAALIQDPVRNIAERVLVGDLPISHLGDRLWQELALDFGNKYAIGRLGNDDVVEIECDAREFASFDMVDMFAFWQRIDVLFHGALNLTERRGDDLILRFPPLTRLEEAARLVYGPEAANWMYVAGEIPGDDINRFHKDRRQPIALSRKPVYFEQAGSLVHGFIYAFHDVYHAIDVAGIHPELLRIGVTLYDSVRALPSPLDQLPFIPTQIHGLAELLHVREMSLDRFLKWAFVPLEETVRRAPHQLMPAPARRQLLEYCGQYVDAIFTGWVGRLPEERHASIINYQNVMSRFVASHREQP